MEPQGRRMTLDLLGGILIGFVLGMGGTLGAVALADRRGLRRRHRRRHPP